MDWGADLEDLLEERVDDASRVEEDNRSFWDVVEELDSNVEFYDRRGTLKHGTAAANLPSIVSEGALLPGKENNSVAGERADQYWVRMTHVFPLAAKYGREAFPDKEKLVDKANSWARFLGKNTADWSQDVDVSTEQGRNEIRNNPMDVEPGLLYGDYYDHVLNSLQKLDRIESGVNDVPVVFETPLTAADYVQTGAEDEEIQDMKESVEIDGVSYPVFSGDTADKYELLGKTGDELEAVNQGIYVPEDPMQESMATRVNLDSDAVIYVPQDSLNEFRKDYDGEDFKIMSLEAKALQHELRMQDKYAEEGKLKYKTPWDIRDHLVNFEWERTEYDENPQTIDISE